MNAGVLYNYYHDNDAAFGSISVYNTFNHDDNMLPNAYRMPLRYTLLFGGHKALGFGGTIYGSLNHTGQAGAGETVIGAAYGIQIGLDKKQEIVLGMWHRLKDAVMPYIGYRLNGFQFGLSYDYTVSGLKSAGEVRNGYELTFVYTAEDKTELKRLIPWY
jgi:hypothetical protein